MPPYPLPLRGIRVTLRVYEPSSRQVREVTVVESFVPNRSRVGQAAKSRRHSTLRFDRADPPIRSIRSWWVSADRA